MRTAVLVVLQTSIFVAVLSVGLRASAAELVAIFRAPALLLRSLLAILVVMPVVAIVVSRALDLPTVIRLALGSLALSPVPPLWPGKALQSGGEASYVIGLLAAAAALSILTVPVGMEVFQWVTGTPMAIAPGTIASIIWPTLLVPLLAGMLVKRIRPTLAARLVRPTTLVAQGLLLVGVVPLLIHVWPAMTALVGNGTLLAMVIFVLAGLAVGHVLAGDPPERRSVLALATAFRHPSIAIAIAHAGYPEQRLAPAAILMYVLVCAVVTFPYQRWAAARQANARPLAR